MDDALFVLDTHALIWWLGDDEALSILAREVIGDAGNTVAVSAASAMEISTATSCSAQS